ncbi:hypothetical protein CA265_24485 [Sphingobacteriaceae bacterium GW460-11-11-14-LB5]|nr:hypothetical protein CA265_24485 [Sphingobacteriaceae bacterium GW460-11-11-14-LB5]
MADQEVIKHVKKTHKILTSKEHSLWHKVGEFILEIIIIVFALSLSIWLHEWSEHRHQQKEVREFMSDLTIEINKMLGEKQLEISELSTIDQKIKNITNTDQITKVITGKYVFYNINSSFEGFKASGKIAFIEDSHLRNEILRYYQDLLPAVNAAKENLEESKKKILYEINSHPEGFTGTKLYRYLYSDYIMSVNGYTLMTTFSIKKGKEIVNQIQKLEK